jgi:hypothetical protein
MSLASGAPIGDATFASRVAVGPEKGVLVRQDCMQIIDRVGKSLS